LSAISKTENAK